MILIIDENSEDIRLDLYLSELYNGISRSKIQNSIKSGKILVNGKEKKPSYILKDGYKVEFENLVENVIVSSSQAITLASIPVEPNQIFIGVSSG